MDQILEVDLQNETWGSGTYEYNCTEISILNDTVVSAVAAKIGMRNSDVSKAFYAVSKSAEFSSKTSSLGWRNAVSPWYECSPFFSGDIFFDKGYGYRTSGVPERLYKINEDGVWKIVKFSTYGYVEPVMAYLDSMNIHEIDTVRIIGTYPDMYTVYSHGEPKQSWQIFDLK